MNAEDEARYRHDAHWPGRTAMVERENMLVAAIDEAIELLLQMDHRANAAHFHEMKRKALAHRSSG